MGLTVNAALEKDGP